MRILVIAALVAATSGCAMFDSGEPLAAESRVVEPSPRPVRAATREAFQPAFVGGSPVALVPCQRKASLAGDCRALGERHEVSAEVPLDNRPGALPEATIEPIRD